MQSLLHDLDAPQIRLSPHEAIVDASRPAPGERRARADARTARRRDRSQPAAARNPTGDEVVAWVGAQAQPVQRSEVHAALGGTLNSVSGTLRRLARAGRLAATGAHGQRAYDALNRAAADRETSTADAATPAALPDRRQRLRLREPCAGPEDLHRLIEAHGPVSSEQVRDLTGCTLQEIAEWGIELACRARVAFEGDGRRRVWRLASEGAVRREVEATIAAQPGALDERRISLTTGIPQAQVGLACAELIDARRVRLEADNTYAPTVR